MFYPSSRKIRKKIVLANNCTLKVTRIRVHSGPQIVNIGGHRGETKPTEVHCGPQIVNIGNKDEFFSFLDELI